MKSLHSVEDYPIILPTALPTHVAVQNLAGKDIFVCAHASRDARCKACGPPLVKWLREEVDLRGKDQVRVWPSSHVGGHVHAANALVFPGGDWYGRVNSKEKAKILLDGNAEDAGLKKMWRGRMGLDEIEQEKLVSCVV